MSHPCHSRCLSRICKVRLESDQGTLFRNFLFALWAFCIIIFLLSFSFMSFPLSLSIYFCFVKFWGYEEWMREFCCSMTEVEEWPPESFSCQQEGFQCWKLWTPELFAIAKQKHKSSKPCNVQPWMEMNNIPLILYKGEQRTNKSGGVFFSTDWTSKRCRKLDYRFLDSLILWLICWTAWISLPKSLNFLFSQPSHSSETNSTLQTDHQ